MHNKLIVILGPTASGKTDLSVALVKKFGGEIISADSRQVYQGLNIGSGKITKLEMQGIKHHLLNVANPKNRFAVSQYQKLATKAIQQIQAKGKLPWLVGGTGFYIQSVVDGIVIPEVKPNWKLRKVLEKKSTAQLYAMLIKLDPLRAKTIDAKNPRRLLRAIEIVKATQKPIAPLKKNSSFDVLQIGITKSPSQLKQLIHKRLERRIAKIIVEVRKLHKNNLSWRRLEELGLEYRFVAQYLQNNIAYEEVINSIQKESEHFAKRQMTWFKRDKRIHWIKNRRQTEAIIKKFLHKKS
jgi:tRNA dimethylallyltransferase